MKNYKTTLKTIYRCSRTGSILLTITKHLIQHKLYDNIQIKTKSKDVNYEVVEVLDVVIDISTSHSDAIIIQEYSVFGE